MGKHAAVVLKAFPEVSPYALPTPCLVLKERMGLSRSRMVPLVSMTGHDAKSRGRTAKPRCRYVKFQCETVPQVRNRVADMPNRSANPKLSTAFATFSTLRALQY
eukprot:2374971-Rhodomonas_salina.2